MQSLDVISVNLWQIVVSLLNLILLYLIIKRFLYRPVKRMLEARQNNIEKQYSEAEQAKQQALLDKKTYEEKLSDANREADSVIKSAVSAANAREQEIVTAAKLKAEDIIRRAESDAALEMRKAENSIRQEIIGVSTALTEKMLEREITPNDHKNLIDSFINNIGDGDDE